MTILDAEAPNVLLVHEDLRQAQQLMDALQSFRREARVTVLEDLNKAHRILYKEAFTAIVITPDFSEEDLRVFVESGRSTFGGQDAAFVLLIDEAHQSEDTLALGMLAGMNGFLYTPFSAEGVDETFQISHKLKTDRIERSLKDEIAIALRAAKRHLDLLCAALHESKEIPIDSKRVGELSQLIKTCAAKNMNLFYRMLVGSFIWETRERPETGAINYRGQSSRVRKIVAAKARRALLSQQPDELDD